MGTARAALVLCVVLTACGSESGNVRDRSSDSPLGGGIGLRLTVSPERPVSAQPVTWLLTLTNEGVEAVDLTFASGKSGDVVLRRDGKEAHRWSDGRFFTEAVRHVRVPPNQAKEYRLQDPGLAVKAGRYDLIATLASEPAPDPVRRSIEVFAG